MQSFTSSTIPTHKTGMTPIPINVPVNSNIAGHHSPKRARKSAGNQTALEPDYKRGAVPVSDAPVAHGTNANSSQIEPRRFVDASQGLLSSLPNTDSPHSSESTSNTIHNITPTSATLTAREIVLQSPIILAQIFKHVPDQKSLCSVNKQWNQHGLERYRHKFRIVWEQGTDKEVKSMFSILNFSLDSGIFRSGLATFLHDSLKKTHIEVSFTEVRSFRRHVRSQCLMRLIHRINSIIEQNVEIRTAMTDIISAPWIAKLTLCNGIATAMTIERECTDETPRFNVGILESLVRALPELRITVLYHQMCPIMTAMKESDVLSRAILLMDTCFFRERDWNESTTEFLRIRTPAELIVLPSANGAPLNLLLPEHVAGVAFTLIVERSTQMQLNAFSNLLNSVTGAALSAIVLELYESDSLIESWIRLCYKFKCILPNHIRLDVKLGSMEYTNEGGHPARLMRYPLKVQIDEDYSVRIAKLHDGIWDLRRRLPNGIRFRRLIEADNSYMVSFVSG
jgi:hypothetical protein